MRVLFVGNSYTHFNNMPDTFGMIARENGHDVTTAQVTHGGYRLIWYSDPSKDEYPRLTTALAEGWDVVFMQEQSKTPVLATDEFLEGARRLCALLPTQVRRCFYVTWGRNDGSKELDEMGMTRLEMTAALHDAYARAAEENEAEMSDVGAAFAYIKETLPQLSLYVADGSHPSPLGSYLIAIVHYHTLFGVLPAVRTQLPKDVIAEEAAMLWTAIEKFF